MTPLHHTLLHGPSPFESGYYFEPGPDKIFETAKVLMEFGANQNLESQPRSIWEKPITARECGINHQYGRVRELFHTSDSPPHNVSQIELYSLQIGRTWMLPSPSETNGTQRDGLNPTRYINNESFFNSLQSVRKPDGDQRQRDNLNLSSFPILNESNQPHMSSLKPHPSDGPWSPASIDSLIACFSVLNEPDTPPITEGGGQVNPFPRLNSHICRDPLETEAGKLWADLRKPKGHTVAEDAISRSASSEKKPLPGEKGTKKHGKSRWQPLTF
ncbi:hypothetical protein JMJ35_000854 [Cladonia borealis]|uniref:Uncharacterized protein n=1 Tax=Cladonia borealis TaxID=184061 RepID=A0AA39UE63_9LECA|nr:hypothetical protein JMJ35_000854 [Cladonia borealis]